MYSLLTFIAIGAVPLNHGYFGWLSTCEQAAIYVMASLPEGAVAYCFYLDGSNRKEEVAVNQYDGTFLLDLPPNWNKPYYGAGGFGPPPNAPWNYFVLKSQACL